MKEALRAAGYDVLRYSNLVKDGSESFIVLERCDGDDPVGTGRKRDARWWSAQSSLVA